MFGYNDHAKLAKVESHLSSERIARYLPDANNSLADAIQLYVWNTEVSAAFHIPLQALEVGLRNAFHTELSNLYCPQWYDHTSFLKLDAALTEPRIERQIEKAKHWLKDRKKPIDPPHVVAALDFGFWTNLVSKPLTPHLWAPALHRAFPNYASPTGEALKRGPIAEKLDFAREFRNRIYHYEPIYYRDLAKDYESILTVCSWLPADVSEWVDHHCVIRKLLAAKPQPAGAAAGG